MNQQATPILLRETSRKLRSAFERHFERAGIDGLRAQDGHVLYYLTHHENVTSAQLQASQGVSKSSISESLAALVGEGYIEYLTSEEDRREKKIVVTAKGLEHQRRVENAVEEFHHIVLQGISEEEEEAFCAVLKKIQANIERRNDE